MHVRGRFRAGSFAFEPRFQLIWTDATSFSQPQRDYSISFSMDIDPSSSPPPVRNTSLPPSSGPGPSLPSNGTPRRTPRRPVADALAFDDEDDGQATEAREQEEATARRRRKVRGQINLDVPIVRDAVGESVRENFETFLKTWVVVLAVSSN